MLCDLTCLFNVNRFRAYVSAFHIFFYFDQDRAAVPESSRTVAQLSREHEERGVLALPDDGYPQHPQKHCRLCKNVFLHKCLN